MEPNENGETIKYLFELMALRMKIDMYLMEGIDYFKIIYFNDKNSTEADKEIKIHKWYTSSMENQEIAAELIENLKRTNPEIFL